MLVPVITLGIEHVLLIAKGLRLSPSLPLSPQEEEEEADGFSCQLTSLIPRHGGSVQLWLEVTVELIPNLCLHLRVFNGEAWTCYVRYVILTFCQADTVVPMATYSLHIDFRCCRCLVSIFQKCWTSSYQCGPGVCTAWGSITCTLCYVQIQTGCYWSPVWFLYSFFKPRINFETALCELTTERSSGLTDDCCTDVVSGADLTKSSELLWWEMLRCAVLCASTWKKLPLA